MDKGGRPNSSRQNMPNRGSVTPLSPHKRKVTDGGISSGVSASHRIYRAPQASIRGGSSDSSKSARGKDKSGTCRRRQGSMGMGSLEAPILWGDGTNNTIYDELNQSQSDYGGVDEIRFRRHGRRQLMLRQGTEDFSEQGMYGAGAYYFDGDDVSMSNEVYSVEERKKKSFYRYSLTPQSILQFILLVVFGTIIFDSHHRVQRHKVQLQRYDEERAHILEQMMWIDKAAKKAHKHYAQKDLWANIHGEDLKKENQDQLREEAEGLRDAVKKLQLRVQLNARERIERRFGESDVEVSLTLDKENKQRIVIALSEDTPHAVDILLSQVERKIWDTLELQQMETGAIQISSSQSETTPVLEFVESSRSCHEVGSVVARQLEAEAMSLNVFVLRVNLKPDTPMGDEDVCIGKIVGGMEFLTPMDGVIPKVHNERYLH